MYSLTQPLLYRQPCLASLDHLDSFLRTLEGTRGKWGGVVRQLSVQGRVFASKGYGVRVQRVLKACSDVEAVEIVGIDDLRPKHLVGNGTVQHLTLLNSSFRPNSHTLPPSLPSFCRALRSLTLANLGLPPPSTHLTDLLQCAAPTLEKLAISSLRDVDPNEFARAVGVLVAKAGRLRSLMVGFLTDEQVQVLCLPLPSASSTTSSSSSSAAPLGASSTALLPALARLATLTHLTFTLPLPSLPLLLSLPPSLLVLTIRPPYSSSSSSSSPSSSAGVFGTSKPALLSLLTRPTPASTPAPTRPSTPSGLGRRRTSVTLEQLEEEELVLDALEAALAVPALPPPASGKAVSVEGVVAPRLEKVRWECRALRCARARVGEVMRRREEWRERVGFGGEGEAE
ncbi:hypothetical protein JCM8097_005897 [Rhodosporidiobolus ruineniae]